MTKDEIKAAQARLTKFAKATNTTAPTVLLADDGGPSEALKAYRRETGVSLDYVFSDDLTGKADLVSSASEIAGLCEAVDGLIKESSFPEMNAVMACVRTAKQKALSLTLELESLGH